MGEVRTIVDDGSGTDTAIMTMLQRVDTRRSDPKETPLSRIHTAATS